MEAKKITSVADILQIAAEAKRKFGSGIWWRGHANSSWTLVAGAFRKDRGFNAEVNMNARFRMAAPSRRRDLPEAKDLPGWLFLMQHFGLPTRLLDWCESPLPAAFFAVSEAAETPGCLWLLAPFHLNGDQTGERSLFMPGNNHALPSFREAFNGAKTPPSDKAVAILPAEVDARMMAQSSRFTIHSTPKPLETFEKSPRYLMSFEVPAAAKAAISNELSLLGVRRSTLFPDLQNLAIDIASSAFGAVPELPELQLGIP